MKKKLISFFDQHWGLSILVVILGLIVIVNLNPNIWLVGWDNFSVSLDLDLNFLRTFSAWRDYRGLGVASDSEMVDVFRQLMLFTLDIFFPANLTEQFYYLLLLATGAVGAHFLSREILDANYQKIQDQWLSQLAGLFSALYYVFNLHTLEVFLFPIAMYAASYAFFPWIIYSFILFNQHKKISRKILIGFIVSSLLVSTSYLTATIFFILLVTMGMITLRLEKSILKYLTSIIFFIALNSFWLLPFSNYYFNKAHLLPTTSSFIEVNESLLNKPISDSGWLKIFTLYPQTLSAAALPYTEIGSGEPHLVHELVHPFAELTLLSKIGILLPLFFVLSGAVVVLVKLSKKNHRQFWVLVLGLFTLVLLRKDLPPTGFIYRGLSNFIPFFKIIFRFSGPKFYPILLLSFTLLLGIGVFAVFKQLLSIDKLKILPQKLLLLPTILLMVLPFGLFFRGDFFSQLVKVKIPSAHFSLATYLNDEENKGRVLHLPYDQFSYWKSYQWGYMGSSFLNFMLDGPLLDRTFEPASPELDQYFVTLNRLVNGITSVSTIEQLRRAELVATLLSRTETEYLLLDETISSQLTEKGLNAWGVFHEEDWRKLISILERQEKISIVKSEVIEAGGESDFHLFLYRVNNRELENGSILSVDPNLENAFIDPLLKTDQVFIQSESIPHFVTYPFWQPRKDIEYNGNLIDISIPFVHDSQIEWSIDQEELASNPDKVYNVFVSLDEGKLEVLLQHNPVPFTNSRLVRSAKKVVFSEYSQNLENKQIKKYLTNWHQLSINPSDVYRLKIGDSLLPLPVEVDQQPTYLASLLLFDQSVDLQLLEMTSTKVLDSAEFSLTDNPNCFEDKKQNYAYEFGNSNNEVSLTTQGGMTCVTAPFIADSNPATVVHYELTVDLQGESSVLPDQENLLEPESSFENQLEEVVLSQPPYSTIQGCLLNSKTNQCLNNRDLIVSNDQQKITLVANELVDSAGVQVLFVLPAKEHEQNSLILKDSSFSTFTPIERKKIELSSVAHNSEILPTTGGERLNLQLPQVHSPDTLYLDSQVEGFSYYSSLCEKENGLRKVAATDQISVLSYLNNCFQELGKSLNTFGHRSYLWDVDYELLAGRQPRFVAKYNSQLISSEFLSRFYLYPQNTANKLHRNSTDDWLTASNFQSAHKILAPIDIASSVGEMEFELQQLAEGQGLMAVDSMSIMALPGYWHNLAVSNGEFDLKVDQLQVAAAERLWPSLWKLTVDSSQVSSEQALLTFNQAYDQQWQIFKTSRWGDALWGKNKLLAEQVKVNGWSNGWLIAADDISEKTTILVFYTPERLVVLGWIITILAIVVSFKLIRSGNNHRGSRKQLLKKRTKSFLRGTK